MWHRLGELLKRHRWVKSFREKHFHPVWEKRTVKRWVRLTSGQGRR